MRGTSALHHRLTHRLLNHAEIRLAGRKTAADHALAAHEQCTVLRADLLHQIRPQETSAIGQRGSEDRRLERRDGDGALPQRRVGGVHGNPVLLPETLRGRAVRPHAHRIADFNAGVLAKPGGLQEFGVVVDADLQPEVDEERIAGDRNRAGQVEFSVPQVRAQRMLWLPIMYFPSQT